MLEKENKRLKENEIENERGRSMVEMLGTLAIMGVLAIGGIAGYRYAMDKYNANEILNEVRKRAITASQQRLLGHSINLSEYGVNTVQGYAIETADNYNGNAGQFTITVKGIEQGVCNQVIDSPLPMVIEELVGDVVVADDVDCTAETNDVLFAFANDLASSSGSDGDGGEGNPPEEFDPTAPENNVFCTDRGLCFSCDDGYSAVGGSDIQDIQLCLDSCSNRIDYDGSCALKDCDGVRREYDGSCHACDTKKAIFVDNNGSCDNCLGIRKLVGTSCVLANCDGFQDYKGDCYPCDTPGGIDVGRSGLCEEKCPNRVKNGRNYCVFNTCDGFWSYWGGCYPCDTPEGIYANKTECDKCKDASGNPIREMNSSGYCNLKSVCENGLQDKYGRCYPCDTPEGIDVGRSGTCGKCSNRVKNGRDYCILNVPCDGFQSESGRCYPCDTASAIDVGSDGTCSEACTGVDKRFKKGSYCNLCPKNVASPALNTQETCEACGGQWNGSVCCDGDRCATTTTP